jgi:hypothetical protein
MQNPGNESAARRVFSSVTYCPKFSFTQATEIATRALQGTPTTACLDAITTALCAYHFPRCEDDEKRFPAVCYTTCDTLKLQCKIELDDIVLVQVRSRYIACKTNVQAIQLSETLQLQGRCQGAPTEDNLALQDKCTAGAYSIHLNVLIAAALPLIFIA